MGGSSKKQTVGYKYYLGMHMILVHGPVDCIRHIKVDNRIAWYGSFAGGRITINADTLFGGESREGGISGAVDFEPGLPTQAKNDYLQSQLGTNIPAWRGVAGLVLRQCYLGINPYLKRWSARLQRIHLRQNGLPQWYDAKAQIGVITKETQAIFLALDNSASMAVMTGNGHSRYYNAQQALSAVLDAISDMVVETGIRADVALSLWGSSASVIERRSASASDLAEIKAFLNASLPIGTATDFTQAVTGAFTFFNGAPASARRSYFFLTDGEPNPVGSPTTAKATLDAIPSLSRYAFNIDLANTDYTAFMDNTSTDGVPVVSGGDPDALVAKILAMLSGQLDMNPAHIIRECLTDPDWGMGYQDSDIDDASFIAAADQLFTESMGISLLWDRQAPIQDFISEVVKHISGSLYVSRTSGKFVLKLIRRDYVEEDLLVLDSSCVERVENASRPTFGELTNSISVNYWEASTGQPASLTVQDQALIQMQGSVINTTLQFPGFTNSRIASRVALRSLLSLSTQLLSCTIQASRVASSLNIGDAFKLTWPQLEIDGLVMRVTGMALGDGRNNRVKITAVQDVFAFPESFMTVSPDVEWEDPSVPPAPADYRVAVEAPYYELVQRLGQTNTDLQLAQNPDIGYILATAARPNAEINARMYTNSGAGFEDAATVDFCPSAFLLEDITPGQTTIPIYNGDDLDQIAVGSHAQIGQELVRIDSVADDHLVVGRGVLDTVPAAHLEGDPILAWDFYAGSDDTEYAMGESVEIKLATVSGSDVLPLAFAPIDTVVLARRATRPYPPGKLLVNGLSYPKAIGGAEELALGWSHRDRLQQTAGELQDTTVGDIGPEAGTTYNLRIYGEAEILLKEVLNAGTSYTYPMIDEQADSLLPSESSDLYWTYVSSLLRLDGVNNAQVFPDETGVVWTHRRNAKISTAQAKFGQSLSLPAFVDPTSTGAAVRLHLHFVGTHGSTAILDSAADQTVTTVGNAAISTTQSVFLGSSLYLDGTGDYLTVVDPTSLYYFSNFFFTIECRVRFDDVTLNQAIACCVDLQAAPFKGWVLRYDPTQDTPGFRLVLFSASGTSDTIQVSWVPAANTFYKIEVSRTSSSVVRFFVNGVQIGTGTIVNAATIGNSGRSLFIGAQDSTGAPNTFFKGYIDEFRIKLGGTPNAANYTPETEPFPSRYWGNYIESTSSSAFGFGTGDFSVATWVYVNGSSPNHVFLDIVQSLSQVSTHYCVFYIDAVTLKLTVAMNGAILGSGGSAVPAASWAYVEFCRAAGVLYAFIDGVLQFTLSSTHDLGTVGLPRIGHSWRTDSGFAGYLDDMEITKGYARHTSGYTPPIAPHPSGAGGGFRLNGRLRVVLESERASVISLQAHDYTVLREGYGFNYGELYGGA